MEALKNGYLQLKRIAVMVPEGTTFTTEPTSRSTIDSETNVFKNVHFLIFYCVVVLACCDRPVNNIV